MKSTQTTFKNKTLPKSSERSRKLARQTNLIHKKKYQVPSSVVRDLIEDVPLPSIVPCKAPTTLDLKAQQWINDFKSNDFQELGWLSVDMGIPVSLLCLLSPIHDISGVIYGFVSDGKFSFYTCDLFSQVDKGPYVTTTTSEIIFNQSSKKIAKYSHPKARLETLLRYHKRYIGSSNAKIKSQANNLSDTVDQMIEFLRYERKYGEEK